MQRDRKTNGWISYMYWLSVLRAFNRKAKNRYHAVLCRVVGEIASFTEAIDPARAPRLRTKSKHTKHLQQPPRTSDTNP